jgi:hypothetical protein
MQCLLTAECPECEVAAKAPSLGLGAVTCGSRAGRDGDIQRSAALDDVMARLMQEAEQ